MGGPALSEQQETQQHPRYPRRLHLGNYLLPWGLRGRSRVGEAAVLVARCRKHRDAKLSPPSAAALLDPDPDHPLLISMLGSDLSVTDPVYPQTKLQSRFLRLEVHE